MVVLHKYPLFSNYKLRLQSGCLFQKVILFCKCSLQGDNADMSQSADDLACCEALARKHHQNFLLLIMGLVERLNEKSERGQPDNDRPANYTQVKCASSSVLKLTLSVIK